MNLPNKLTVARMFMIPVVLAAIMLGGTVIPEYIAYPIAALLFGITSFTDFLDGKIARKYNNFLGITTTISYHIALKKS